MHATFKKTVFFVRCETGGRMAWWNTIRQKKDSLKIWMTVIKEVIVVRPQYAEFCCSDTCQMLVNWEVVIQRSFTAREMFGSDSHWLWSVFIQIQRIHFPVLQLLGGLRGGVLAEISSSLCFTVVSSWSVGVCGQSTPAPPRAASRRPPNTGLSCSSGTCAAARWRPRMLAWPGRGRRRGGWPRAGACPEPSSCRRVGAPRRWRTSRGRGSGERSPCPAHMTPASDSAGKTTEQDVFVQNVDLLFSY